MECQILLSYHFGDCLSKNVHNFTYVIHVKKDKNKRLDPECIEKTQASGISQSQLY